VGLGHAGAAKTERITRLAIPTMVRSLPYSLQKWW